MYSKLLLASTSEPRRALLEEARIPVQVIEQYADEYACSWDVPVNELVQNIARLKMECAVVPSSLLLTEDVVCIVTADTLVADAEGKVYGKPHGRADAAEMIRALRNREILVVTGMCVERRHFRDGMWVTDVRREVVSTNKVLFVMTDDWISWYLDNTPSIFVAGTFAFDNVGLRFARYLEGSVAAIRGLPVHELHQELIELGFYGVLGEL